MPKLNGSKKIGRRHIHKKKYHQEKRYRINHQIRVPEVKLIDPDEGLIGIVPTTVALEKAYAKGLTLVEVSPKETPPVAKLLDFGKFKYEQEKKKQKQKGKKIEIKSIRLNLNMGEHDIETRKKQALKFFEHGHNTHIEMVLKGREMVHASRAFEQMKTFLQSFETVAEIAEPVTKKNRRLTALVQPRKKI